MLRHKHARVARRIALDVVVHRTVANGVAEARLLMPHPKTSTGEHQHNGNGASHDGRLLLVLPFGRMIRVGRRGGALAFVLLGHWSPFFVLGLAALRGFNATHNGRNFHARLLPPQGNLCILPDKRRNPASTPCLRDF